MSYAGVGVTAPPRWKTYLRLGRVSNLPTVWTNVLAGAALAGSIPSPFLLILLAAAVSLFYTGGMFLNDAFDREIDARERPERPIPAGDVAAGEVYLAGFGMLVLGYALTWLAAERGDGSELTLAAAASLAGAIVLYNRWHKGNPLGPALMGLCRALVYATVALAVTRVAPASVGIGAAALFCYVIGLTYVAKQETHGHVRNLWPLLLLTVPLAAGATGAGGVTRLAMLGALLGWAVYSLSFLRASRPDVPGAVVRLIAGITLVDALLIAHSGFAGLAWVAVLGLPLTLFFQRHVRGT